MNILGVGPCFGTPTLDSHHASIVNGPSRSLSSHRVALEIERDVVEIDVNCGRKERVSRTLDALGLLLPCTAHGQPKSGPNSDPSDELRLSTLN